MARDRKKTIAEELAVTEKKTDTPTKPDVTRGIDTTVCILCRVNPPQTNDGKTNLNQNTCRACRQKHLKEIQDFEPRGKMK